MSSASQPRVLYGRTTNGVKKADTDSLPGIQLNDRQMKLYAARKSGLLGKGMKEQNHALAPPPAASKQQQQLQHPYLGREPTQTAETVPNTFSEDSEVSYGSYTSHSSSSRQRAASNFYGQRLDSNERKMYDDQGNTWRDSQSEAAASAVSAALSRASSKKSSVSLSSMARLRQLNQQRNKDQAKSSSMSSAGSTAGSTYSRSSTSSSSKASYKTSSSSSKSVKMSSDSRSVVSAASKAPSNASSSLRRKTPVAQTEPDDKLEIKRKGSSVVASETRSHRPELTPIDTQPEDEKEQSATKASGLTTQKEKNKFLRKTMMQWAKPSSSSSLDPPTGMKSTTSAASNTSSKASSRRLSFAPKKSIIPADYRSPKSMASGSISPKEMAIMRKVAERNNKTKTAAKPKRNLSPLSKDSRRAAGKMIKTTPSRLKKLLRSSSTSSPKEDSNSSELKPVLKRIEDPIVETATSNQSSTLYDDSGNNVDPDALSSVFTDHLVDDEEGPMDEAKADTIASLARKTNAQGPLMRRPIVLEEDMEDEEDDQEIIARNQAMRKRNKRGRSSIFKRRIGNIGMGIVDDLMEENEELSSDDDEPDYDDPDPPKDMVSVGADSGYVTAASLHKARSIKSNAFGMTPRTISDTPRTINTILDENKEFLHTMREGPLKTAKQIPDLIDNDPTMSESYDEEKEEYRKFTKILKAELSGTHSKLFDSFHAMFRPEGGEQKTRAKPLSFYPGSLDLKTKEAIASMSKYLNTEHDVECMLGSQIVKDSDVRNFQFQHTSRTPRKPKSQSDDEYRTIRQIPSSDSINAGAEGSEFEVTLGQHVRKSESFAASDDSRYLQASASKLTAKQRGNASSVFKLPPAATGGNGAASFDKVKLKKSRAAPAKIDTETEGVPSSWTKVKLRKVNPAGRQINTEPTESTETAEFHRIVLRKTPTNAGGLQKKSFERAPIKTAPSSLTDTSGTSKKPIDIERAGDGPSAPIKLTTPTPAANNVKLTPMSGTSGKPIEVKDTRKGGEDNPIKLAPSVGYDEGNPIQLVPSRGEESCNPIALAPSIDLDLNEGSIMVALAKEEGAGEDVDIHVIVGMDGITKVQSIPGQASSTKANVVWKLERNEVKSALLDLSSYHVKIIVSSDNDKTNKDLQFPSSAQCMRFANALHEMKETNSSPKTTSETKSVPSVTEDTASVYVEQLSNDEQKVLDEFRQRKKNNPMATDLAKDILSKKIGGPMPMSVVNGNGPSSPVSEVSGATSALNTSLDHNATMKYQLMLKMKVPKEAVKSKMKEDGVEANVIATLLGEEAPTKIQDKAAQANSASSLSPEDEQKASTYRKMLKMRIPPEAVAHKMKKDGIEQRIVEAVLDGGAPSNETEVPSAAPSGPKLTLPEQAAAQKYQKMLKMCVPKEAVEHKMKKDGVDAKIIAFVLGGPAPDAPATASSGVSKKKPSSALTPEEEKTATPYKRMLKMSIPKEAVRHKMMKDGVAEKVISAVLGDDKKASGKSKATKPKKFNKAGFHWNVIDDDVSIAGSVWSKTKSEAGSSVAAFDISKHVDEFQKKAESTVAVKKKTASGQDKKEMAKLIELNRAQNVAITLKAFNDCSYKQLAQIIEFLDPAGKIKGDRALFMKDLLPTLNEVKAIKSYTGGDEFLIPAERWFRHVVHIKRIEEKVQVMRTMETFKMDAVILGKSFQLLTDVCNQVMESDRLPDLLDMVRQIGNRMNKGNGDDAAGFKLDFLPKLAQTKGSDKKTTALDLVILIFCTRNQREALQLSDDFPDIQEASRIQFSDLTADAKNLEASFRKCSREFESLKKEHEFSLQGKAPKSNFKVPTDSKSDLGNGNALMDAIKARNGSPKGTPTVAEVRSAIHKSNEKVRKSLSPRASLLASLSEKSNGEVEFSIEASIRRLEKFVGEAKYVILPKLESDRAAAVQACTDLSSFFCENGGERVASNLLKILAEFASNIDRSVKKYDEQQRILARKEAALKKKKNKSASSSKKSLVSKVTKKVRNSKNKASTDAAETKPNPPVAVEEGQKKSIVLMVNEMLKVAGDKEIDDFVSGKRIQNPDSRLQQIYNAEEARKGLSERGDILTAIKKRRSMSINPVPDQALSDLRATLSEESRDEMDSKRRRSRVVNRWSSKRDPPSKPPLDPTGSSSLQRSESQDTDDMSTGPSKNNARKSRVANRWSSKAAEKTDSEILSSISEDTNDIVLSQKRRQSVVNRWASKGPTSTATVRDLDEDSDIGAFQEMIDRRKQNALNRWSSKKK